MLVLSRKVGDYITIGKDIKVYLLAIKGNRVSLGVDAPKETRIRRRETKPSETGGDCQG